MWTGLKRSLGILRVLVDVRILLDWNLKKQCVGILTGFNWPVWLLWHNNESWVSIRKENFLTTWASVSAPLHWINCPVEQCAIRLYMNIIFSVVSLFAVDRCKVEQIEKWLWGGGWHEQYSFLVFYMASGSKATFVEIVMDRRWTWSRGACHLSLKIHRLPTPLGPPTCLQCQYGYFILYCTV
jgi:hypothetical protein